MQFAYLGGNFLCLAELACERELKGAAHELVVRLAGEKVLQMDDLVRRALSGKVFVLRDEALYIREPGDRTPAVIEPLKLVCVGN